MKQEPIEAQDLEREATHVLEEARMVLPGIQALFGFQLVAVFDSRFDLDLLPAEQRLHLAAIVLVALAVLLIMAPAAYHRQAERGRISRYFVRLASRLLTFALAPLLLGIVVEIFIVARVILRNTAISLAIATMLLAAFVGLWFVFPYMKRRVVRGRQTAATHRASGGARAQEDRIAERGRDGGRA